jgi:tetratricopeptide (TPR) repeat protein
MARQISRSAALAVLMISGSAASVVAQPRMNRGPNPDAPKLMVSACRTTDKVLAVQCADKIRTEIEGDVSFRVLYVRPKVDIENTLTQSGYDPAVALAPADAVALARSIQADMYIDATVDKTANGYKITAAAVLQRDANLAQPLGTFEAAKLDDAVKSVSRSFTEAFEKSFQDQKECFTLARERRTADAQKRVDAVLKSYPKSSWIRFCQLGLLTDAKAPIAQTLKVLEEIVAADPTNKTALRQLVLAYDQTGDKAKKVERLEQLLAADPNDPTLMAQVINSFAELGQFDKALPIAEKGVAMHQGNMDIIRPYWLILNARKDYKKALDVGKMMATLDTAAADSSYYISQIGTASADSNFAAAAELADQAGIKYPKLLYNGTNVNAVASALWKRAGNAAKEKAALDRWVAADPNAATAKAVRAQAMLAENPPKFDEVIAMVKEMIAANQDKEMIAGIAVQTGNVMMTKNAVDSLKAKGLDAATTRATLVKVFQTTAWADTLATGSARVGAQAKFIMGVSAINLSVPFLQEASEIGQKLTADVKAIQPPNAARQKALVDAAEAQICPLIAESNKYITIASAAVPAGGRFAPREAQQAMGSVMQLNQNIEQYKKGYHCK